MFLLNTLRQAQSDIICPKYLFRVVRLRWVYSEFDELSKPYIFEIKSKLILFYF